MEVDPKAKPVLGVDDGAGWVDGVVVVLPNVKEEVVGAVVIALGAMMIGAFSVLGAEVVEPKVNELLGVVVALWELIGAPIVVNDGVEVGAEKLRGKNAGNKYR